METTHYHFDGFECGAYFCATPHCVLHVRAGDAGTRGAGQWATLSTGLTVGRRLVNSNYLCDLCVSTLSNLLIFYN